MTLCLYNDWISADESSRILSFKRGRNLHIKRGCAVHLRIIISLFLLTFSTIVTVTHAYAQETQKSAVILMYHRFGEDRYPTTNVRIEQFEAHINELKMGGYNVLPVKDIVSALKKGESLPLKTVGISVDDAYLSVYEKAFPRLKKERFPFTVFVSSGAIGSSPSSFATWDQINEMVDSGLVDIGNHLVSHDSAISIDDTELRRQINSAQSKIREKTGITPELFSFPYGEYALEDINTVKQTGFIAAFGQHSGAIGTKSDFLALPRYALNENFSNIDRFRLIANSIPLPVSDVTPEQTHLNSDTNPPAFGFTVDDNVKNLRNLKCYASAGGDLTLERIGSRRFEIRLEKAFPPGRSRINCTTLAPNGRWRWLGQQFVVGEGGS